MISRSPGDIGPVLDAVAQNASRLCEAPDVAIVRRDGDTLRVIAATGPQALVGPWDHVAEGAYHQFVAG